MAQTNVGAASAAQAQASAASSGAGHAMLDSGSKINAVMKSNLDARKSHVGDVVTAESTQSVKSHGKVIVPKHSRLLGHVTSVSAQGKGSSAVGVLFDEAVTPQGQHIPLNAGISSVFTAAGAASSMAPDAGPMPMPQMMPAGGASAGGGLLGGAGAGLGSAVGSVAGGVTSTAGAALQGGALSSSGSLMGSSVFRGSNGVPLQIRMLPASPGTAQANGSLLTSGQGDVRLDRGTRVQLQTTSQSSAQAQPGSASVASSTSAQAQAHHR